MGADLHLHSTYSDGSFSPAELVEMASECKLTTIAVADHDTVAGVKEAVAAGEKLGIEVIPGLELSTFRGRAEIHILGYFIDTGNKYLLTRIEEIFSARRARARKMIALLNREGIDITIEQVKRIAGDQYIGRPHIARAMVESNYIKEMGEAFTEDYIGNEGPAYVPKYKITPEEAIELIVRAEGVPVLAHPVFINHGDPLQEPEIEELVDNGLQGIEVYHSKLSQNDSRHYKRIAEKLDLLITGGTDFHGENSPGVKLGDIILPGRCVTALRNFAGRLEENNFRELE